MDQNTNRTTLKIFGVIMLLFGIVYGIVGSLALAGTLQGVLPGHQTQEILVIVLAYGVALALVLALAAAFLVDSSMFEGLLPAVMEQLSLFERFNTFVNGVFDVTAIVYYLSVIGFFLLLSVQSMEKRRYN